MRRTPDNVRRQRLYDAAARAAVLQQDAATCRNSLAFRSPQSCKWSPGRVQALAPPLAAGRPGGSPGAEAALAQAALASPDSRLGTAAGLPANTLCHLAPLIHEGSRRGSLVLAIASAQQPPGRIVALALTDAAGLDRKLRNWFATAALAKAKEPRPAAKAPATPGCPPDLECRRRQEAASERTCGVAMQHADGCTLTDATLEILCIASRHAHLQHRVVGCGSGGRRRRGIKFPVLVASAKLVELSARARWA
jgi:hypothetical protein